MGGTRRPGRKIIGRKTLRPVPEHTVDIKAQARRVGRNRCHRLLGEIGRDVVGGARLRHII